MYISIILIKICIFEYGFNYSISALKDNSLFIFKCDRKSVNHLIVNSAHIFNQKWNEMTQFYSQRFCILSLYVCVMRQSSGISHIQSKTIEWSSHVIKTSFLFIWSGRLYMINHLGINMQMNFFFLTFSLHKNIDKWVNTWYGLILELIGPMGDTVLHMDNFQW